MANALRVHQGHTIATWSDERLQLALIDGYGNNAAANMAAPVQTQDGRHCLWMAGEVFRLPTGWSIEDAVRLDQLLPVLLDALVRKGADAILEMDGEYVVVWWDTAEQRLTIINDRFGSLPTYWTSQSDGFAFANGVRGVLAAPGVSLAPDAEALRDMVSFGGFRLGDRTNVQAVRLLSGAGCLTAQPGAAPSFKRYWHWNDIPPQEPAPITDLIEQAHSLWDDAIERRLADAKRPGQTLSGGLDSRLILASAAPRAPGWTAITYGLGDSDEVRIAHRAARAMNVAWVHVPLYWPSGEWLQYRSRHIQRTDGLVELGDLKHFESLDLQTKSLDLNISGYIGDAVCGPTFNDVQSPKDILLSLPYYGGVLCRDHEDCLSIAQRLSEQLDGAPARFALFESKLPQSTNLCLTAARPWIRVRRPFIDYRVFDFWQGLSSQVRGKQRLYERWLRAKYPRCFAGIPHQKTGMPVLTPYWRWQTARAMRFGRRLAANGFRRLGLAIPSRRRSFTDDWQFWRAPGVRRAMEEVIFRRESICCDLFGRKTVQALTDAWFEQGAAPTQVIGALYTYEVYHRDIGAWLRGVSHVPTENSKPCPSIAGVEGFHLG